MKSAEEWADETNEARPWLTDLRLIRRIQADAIRHCLDASSGNYFFIKLRAEADRLDPKPQ